MKKPLATNFFEQVVNLATSVVQKAVTYTVEILFFCLEKAKVLPTGQELSLPECELRYPV